MNNILNKINWKPFRSSLFDTVKVRVWVKHLPLIQIAAQQACVVYSGKKYKVCGKFGKCRAIIFSDYTGESLVIEASLSKFLTGQNVVGREDLVLVTVELINEVLKRAGITPSDEEKARYQSGDFELMRVDYASHIDCGTAEAAKVMMVAIRATLAAKECDYSAYKNETVYWGQESRRRTLCMYRKGAELTKRPICRRSFGCKSLTKKSQSLVRLEFTLRGDELKRLGLDHPEAWTAKVARKLLADMVDQVLPLDRKIPSVEGMDSLPRSLQDRLELWLRGSLNAFSRYSDSAFRENRRAILEATGIDIRSTLTQEEQAKYFVTLKDVKKAGEGFCSWKSKWLKLLAGKKDA